MQTGTFLLAPATDPDGNAIAFAEAPATEVAPSTG
jgi:hypothetical protein